jgi:nucleoside-triphosphatase
MSNEGDTGCQSPVFIVSGEQAEGKTTFLMDILARLEDHTINIRGIIAPGYFRDDIRSGFSVVDVATGTGVDLCSDIPYSGAEQHGRYYFRPEGLSFGRRTLLISPDQRTLDLIVIDEVGRFDVRGALWGGCIDQLVKKIHPPMIWTVRNEFVEMVINRWPMIRPVVVNINSMSVEQCVDDILKEIALFKKLESN